MKRATAPVLLAALLAMLAEPALAYPLDASEATGITRLEAYRLGHETKVRHGGRLLPEGALLRTTQVRLSMLAHPDFELPAPDPAASATLRETLGADAPHYSVSLLDITDPAKPVFAAVNPDQAQQPGSVGKIAVALAWFQVLADVHPAIPERIRLLYQTEVVADDFIHKDHHVVPFWKPGDSRVDMRPIEEGDRANLWTWLDWMTSNSSNAAASELISQAMLMKKFGKEYPVSAQRAQAFWSGTAKSELASLFGEVMVSPLRRSGLDPGRFQQGSFFTRAGKNRVPSLGSTATSRELLRYFLRMEQGRLVDEWSSLEIKKLLYLTEQRIRYAAQPALGDSALYFKSGSLYSCKPETGYQCAKFMGNRLNYMNSIVLVESVETDPPLRYIASVLSNVLKKNSAQEHTALALRIHRMVGAHHGVTVAVPETPAPAQTLPVK
jgi:hypothetical protein